MRSVVKKKRILYILIVHVLLWFSGEFSNPPSPTIKSNKSLDGNYSMVHDNSV